MRISGAQEEYLRTALHAVCQPRYYRSSRDVDPVCCHSLYIRERAMFTEYLDFKIEIGQKRGGTSFPVSISAPGGDARGTLRLPTSDRLYQELSDKLVNLSADEETLARVGQILFKLLFQGPAKDVLARSQGVLGPDQGPRIVL